MTYILGSHQRLHTACFAKHYEEEEGPDHMRVGPHNKNKEVRQRRSFVMRLRLFSFSGQVKNDEFLREHSEKSQKQQNRRMNRRMKNVEPYLMKKLFHEREDS